MDVDLPTSAGAAFSTSAGATFSATGQPFRDASGGAHIRNFAKTFGTGQQGFTMLPVTSAQLQQPFGGQQQQPIQSGGLQQAHFGRVFPGVRWNVVWCTSYRLINKPY